MRLLVLALVLVAACAARADAWGLTGHGAISLKAAEKLGLPADERHWFALGGVMGDLDKSDWVRKSVSSPFMRFLASFGNSYEFPSLVDQHDGAYLAELIDLAGRSGDPRLEAWALGVLSHRRADRVIDTYPDAAYRLDAGIAEVTCDVEIFRGAEGGRFAKLLETIEGDDQMVYSPRRSIPWTWWFYGRSGSLRRGKDHDDDVRRVDPFAALILETWKRSHPGATGGPRNVSDVWRQQSAFDAFTWNYRLKSPFYPGRADFVRQKGQAWLTKMKTIAFDDAVNAIEAETKVWQTYLRDRRAGRQTTRPTVP
jgi:hypothetical protein